MGTDVRPELSVLMAVRTGARLPAIVEALGEQSAGPETFELVIADATPAGIELTPHPDVDVVIQRAEQAASDAELLDQARRSARGTSVVFLAEELVPAPLWVEAMQRQLRRGRRVVTGSWLPDPASVGSAGRASQHLWTAREEVAVATTDQLACLASDLEAVGGVPRLDDAADRGVELAARLVDNGADPSWARHAVVYHPVERDDLTTALRERRRTTDRTLGLLDQHPRARARLMPAGLVPHRRHAEVLLLLLALLLGRRDRRALVLATPWLHERTCLTPRAGGGRRRWFVLPGVLLVDVHDAVTSVVARLRPPQPRG